MNFRIQKVSIIIIIIIIIICIFISVVTNINLIGTFLEVSFYKFPSFKNKNL
jgi:hypothetical protein